MKLAKGVVLSLFTVIITFIAIYLNWSEFLIGNSATVFNFIVSNVFIALWIIFSFYWGIKQQKIYIKFILIYWGINFISFILIWIISQINATGFFLLPFAVWYGSPVYGFRYLLKWDVTKLILVTAPLGLTINALGYWSGLMLSNVNKS